MRGMGMFFGGVLVAIGLLMVLSSAGVEAIILSSPAPKAAIDFIGPLMGVVLGAPLFLWGRSVFRRARTDEEVVAAIGFGSSNARGLAWVAFFFSAAMLVGLVLVIVKGEHLNRGALSGAGSFTLVLAASARHLFFRREETPKP